MLCALIFSTFFSVIPRQAGAQPPSVLHIKVVLTDADQKATPVARHALLISENPASAAPRRIVTALDGTADVQLRPGNYTVESDRPVAFHGHAYQWTQTVDVAAGRDTVLELTVANAEVEVGPVSPTATTSAQPLEADPSPLLAQWRDSVVALWTPTTHASGFLIDAKGLIATNQRVIGGATSVEVQLTPALKVTASVLAANAVRGVAILWIDPQIAATVRPVPLGCAQETKPPVANGQEIYTIGAPLREPKDMTSGTVSRIQAHDIVSDLALPTGSAGGPVFTAAGGVIGITSPLDEKEQRRRGDSSVVPIDDVCEVVATAETKMKGATAPNGTHLPVEPVRPFPVDALKDAAQHRGGSLNPYTMSSSDFDIAFITPVLIYGAQYQAEQASQRERGRESRTPIAAQALVRPLMDFSNWSDYVADYPPVLLIRVTPKLAEGLWMKVARGAASTQGVSIPPIKRLKSGFSRMRTYCGAIEVTPIHPFKLEQAVSDTESIYEGLYAFDPGALTSQCGTVKLVLYSEKEPDKGDTKVVDPKVLEQIWQDFAPYRALKTESGGQF